MLSWLKYTAMSFFSNKISKEGGKRSFWNVLFAVFISIIIITAFVATGFNYSFPTHYYKADKFQNLVYNTFANEDINERIKINIIEDKDNNDTYLKASFNDNSEVLINTFENESDSKYIVDGYNLIIDTRPSESTFFKIDIKYTYEEKNISVAEYNLLEDDDKANYIQEVKILNEKIDTSNVKYIDNNQEITISVDDMFYKVQSLTSSLNEDDANLVEFKVIEEAKNNNEEYYDRLYVLYCKTYLNLTSAKTNRDYYQEFYTKMQQYVPSDKDDETIYKDFLIVTYNWSYVSFTDSDGHVYTFDGIYTELADGFTLYDVYNQSKIDEIKSKTDTFILSLYGSRYSLNTLTAALNVFSFIPYIIFSLCLFGLLIFCVCKLKKRGYGNKFLDSFKIASSYLIISSSLASMIGMVLFFILDTSSAFGITCWGLLSILGFRTIILIICEEIAYKKNPNRDVVVSKEKDVLYEENLADLSKVDTGNKVIINDVDDDEIEKMDFM